MSAWEDALDYVASTSLPSIDGTGQYTYTVAATNIYRDVIEKEAVASPGIIMLPGRMVYERRASNRRRYYSLPLTLAGVLRCDNTDQKKDTQLNALGTDILHAMTNPDNYFHGNRVTDTHFDGMETFFVPDELLGLVMVDFRLDINNTWEIP